MTGILIGLVACIVPALLLSGFFGSRIGTWRLWLPVAGGGGAVGGLICMDELRRWFVGAVAGAVAAVGALLVTAWWASWRSNLYSVELLLVALVGGVPGMLLGGVISKLPRRVPNMK